MQEKNCFSVLKNATNDCHSMQDGIEYKGFGRHRHYVHNIFRHIFRALSFQKREYECEMTLSDSITQCEIFCMHKL